MGTKYRAPCQEEGELVMGVKITVFAAKCPKVHVKHMGDEEVRVKNSRREVLMALVSIQSPGPALHEGHQDAG